MGHTIVAGFDERSTRMLHNWMEPFGANKIPFGRNCDRESANQAMDFHMTMFHWAKTMDDVFLPRLTGFSAVSCQIRVRDIQIMTAEENSWLLYFDVEPTESYLTLAGLLEEQLAVRTSSFLHITLAVSKNQSEIRKMYSHICETVEFPFLLDIDRLDLYHIWKPTGKVGSF